MDKENKILAAIEAANIKETRPVSETIIERPKDQTFIEEDLFLSTTPKIKNSSHTIRMSDSLWKKLKKKAFIKDVPISTLISKACQSALKEGAL